MVMDQSNHTANLKSQIGRANLKYLWKGSWKLNSKYITILCSIYESLKLDVIFLIQLSNKCDQSMFQFFVLSLWLCFSRNATYVKQSLRPRMPIQQIRIKKYSKKDFVIKFFRDQDWENFKMSQFLFKWNFPFKLIHNPKKISFSQNSGDKKY
jgi:hypothetical protein